MLPGPRHHLGLGRAMVCRVAAGRPRARLLRPPRALSTAAHPNSCWRCGAGMASFTLTCERCSPPTIQPMAGWPLFELFDTEPAVRLDLGELERAFKNLQRKLHPDLFHQRSEEEQELSAANSALVNAGYQTLRHPLERVKYLLSLHGIEVLAETAGTISDPTLLMEVMEIRDEISTCTSGAALRKLADANAARLEALMEALERHYGAGDYGAIGDSAIELQYFSKIEEEISLRADVVG
mmetsp:Transcript_28296/g.58026  ORF Transcript_28296/g.58026 Transcript_28296/m.58026 type:complete len:239 (-) Transcript_28296:71-787(-)